MASQPRGVPGSQQRVGFRGLSLSMTERSWATATWSRGSTQTMTCRCEEAEGAAAAGRDRAITLEDRLRKATEQVSSDRNFCRIYGLSFRYLNRLRKATEQVITNPYCTVGLRLKTLRWHISSSTLLTGPRRSLRLKLSDTRVYVPQMRARLGTTGGISPTSRAAGGTRARDLRIPWLRVYSRG